MSIQIVRAAADAWIVIKGIAMRLETVEKPFGARGLAVVQIGEAPSHTRNDMRTEVVETRHTTITLGSLMPNVTLSDLAHTIRHTITLGLASDNEMGALAPVPASPPKMP